MAKKEKKATKKKTAKGRNVSSLEDHIVYKKKGVVATPYNDGLGDMLKLSSWAKERMPGYLWLGLILQCYERTEGLEKAGPILDEISKTIKTLSLPSMSMILKLADSEQRKVYDIICKVIDKEVMSPLTILYKNDVHPVFNEYFFTPQFQVDERIEILLTAIKTYSPSQSFEATDLRFLVVFFMCVAGKLHFPPHLAGEFDILGEYPYTDHDNEKMKSYRPNIRSLEGSLQMLSNDEEIQCNEKIWRDIGMITPCNPMAIKFDNNTEDYSGFISDCQKSIEYVLATNKDKSLSEDRFDVIVGSINYALKIFVEINEKSLGNNILGRHGIRTIIELLIILKYLIKNEAERSNIWGDYKSYGIGKYKLILLKARETILDAGCHFVPKIVDLLVNENISEEFIDVDLKYFDKKSIREKSIDVEEKELYDLYYDYDSSFAHGLWGSIRESAMLNCDNAAHQYHSIPDTYSGQNLPDVKSDSMKIMKKLIALLSDIYEIPCELLDKPEGP